jgi:hypothetical protein
MRRADKFRFRQAESFNEVFTFPLWVEIAFLGFLSTSAKRETYELLSLTRENLPFVFRASSQLKAGEGEKG